MKTQWWWWHHRLAVSYMVYYDTHITCPSTSAFAQCASNWRYTVYGIGDVQHRSDLTVETVLNIACITIIINFPRASYASFNDGYLRQV